jgi:hypothetical protein
MPRKGIYIIYFLEGYSEPQHDVIYFGGQPGIKIGS